MAVTNTMHALECRVFTAESGDELEKDFKGWLYEQHINTEILHLMQSQGNDAGGQPMITLTVLYKDASSNRGR